MAPFAMVFGALLTLLGVGTYVYIGMEHFTALIPAFFGAALLVLGALALVEGLRMHAMHVAALLGLVGFALPAYRLVASLAKGDAFELVKHGELGAMSGLCLVFLVLCVKSFIDARIARKKREADSQAS